jgi:hypothetical protein
MGALVKIHEVFQGSVQWLQLRAGIPTASEWEALVSPKWEIRKGKMPETYLSIKAAERWRGGPLPGFSSFATKQGKLREERALPAFELEYKLPRLQRPGFITNNADITQADTIGCSPDGMMDDGCGVEAKCPEPHTHVKWLRGNKIPDEHLAQVYGSMLVTGARKWTFYSYCAKFPSLAVQARRDEKILKVLRTALDRFLKELEETYAFILEKNLGIEPDRPRLFVPSDNVDPRTLLFKGLRGENDEVGLLP